MLVFSGKTDESLKWIAFECHSAAITNWFQLIALNCVNENDLPEQR